MRRLGKVLHVSKVSKRLIVRSNIAGALKGYVVDRTGYMIGEVDEVFGPADGPYYAVRPSRKVDPAKYVGEEVFIAPHEEREPKKRGKRVSRPQKGSAEPGS